MDTPTPLHPVATTQAGELSIDQKSALMLNAAQAADNIAEASDVELSHAEINALVLDHILAAIEMQASHSAAQWVCTQCGKDCANPFADDICACGNDAFRLRDRAHPSPTTAPATCEVEAYNSRTCERGTNGCGVNHPPTAPAATTPAASIDSPEFDALLTTFYSTAYSFAGSTPSPHARAALIAHINAHTAAQVAANKPAEVGCEKAIAKLDRVSKWIDKFAVPTEGATAMMLRLREVSEFINAHGYTIGVDIGGEDETATFGIKPAESLTEDQMSHVLKCRSMREVAERAYNLGLQGKPAAASGELPTYTVHGTVLSALEYINYLHGKLDAPQHQVQAGGDAARLDFIERNSVCKYNSAGVNWQLGQYDLPGGYLTLREAIDAAMKGGAA